MSGTRKLTAVEVALVRHVKVKVSEKAAANLQGLFEGTIKSLPDDVEKFEILRLAREQKVNVRG